MIFKVIILLFLSLSTLFGAISIKVEDQNSKELVRNWFLEKFKIENLHIDDYDVYGSEKNYPLSKINIVILNNNLSESEKTIHEYVVYENKKYLIEPTASNKAIVENPKISFYSQLKNNNHFVWQIEDTVFINGKDFIYKQYLGNVLEFFFRNEYSHLFYDKKNYLNTDTKINEFKKPINLEKIVKGVILFFSIGLIFLIIFFIKNIYKNQNN